MILFLIIVFALSFYRARFVRPVLSGLNEQYLAPDSTVAVKGIFILLVFLSHANNYLLDNSVYTANVLNQPYIDFQAHLGQGVVVLFLFYSGYGVMESIRKKGAPYVNAMPKRRVLKTLIHFDLAVFLFLFLRLAFGTLGQTSVWNILLAFTGWTSIGNSNWYIFAMLMLYLFTFLAFKWMPKKPVRALWLVTAFTVLYIAVLAVLKDAWWFDTVLLYPIGMWYSFHKEKIESVLFSKQHRYWLTLGVSLAVMIVSHLLRTNYLCYEIWMISLAITVVLVTMKWQIANPVLQFFGKHLFEIYILMRIPMMVLLHFGITNTYVFVLVSFVATVVLAVLFKKFLNAVDRKLFKPV